jgi:hypothetical protein
VEQLCLDGVEVREGKQHFELGVLKGGHWQRVKVQQRCNTK